VRCSAHTRPIENPGNSENAGLLVWCQRVQSLNGGGTDVQGPDLSGGPKGWDSTAQAGVCGGLGCGAPIDAQAPTGRYTIRRAPLGLGNLVITSPRPPQTPAWAAEFRPFRG
jgi:hypothetical protein